MERIRVLRAITWLPVGGIERKLVEVLPRLDRERFDVSVVCLRERGALADELESAGIRVDLVPFRTRWDPRALSLLRRLMVAQRVDVVHAHMYRSNVPATVAARWAGIPHVWGQVHNMNSWDSWRQLQVDRLLCRWREGMLAVSEHVGREVIERLGIAPEELRVIYNGVNLSRFQPGGRGRTELRHSLGVGPHDLVVLFAARLIPQKRPADFIALARAMSGDDAPTRPELHFWLAGDGALRRELEAPAQAASVHLLGRRDDMPELLAAADVFVMTSTREGFSNALLEAMAAGLCVIATDVGGNSEAVVSGRDGLIVPLGDPAALAAATRSVLTKPSRLAEFGKAARERAHAFSLDSMVANLEDLYESSVRGG